MNEWNYKCKFINVIGAGTRSVYWPFLTYLYLASNLPAGIYFHVHTGARVHGP